MVPSRSLTRCSIGKSSIRVADKHLSLFSWRMASKTGNSPTCPRVRTSLHLIQAHTQGRSKIGQQFSSVSKLLQGSSWVYRAMGCLVHSHGTLQHDDISSMKFSICVVLMNSPSICGSRNLKVVTWGCWGYPASSFFPCGRWTSQLSLIPFWGSPCQTTRWHSLARCEPDHGQLGQWVLLDNVIRYFKELSCLLFLPPPPPPLSFPMCWQFLSSRSCKYRCVRVSHLSQLFSN